MAERTPFDPQRWTADGVARAAKAAEQPPKAAPKKTTKKGGKK